MWDEIWFYIDMDFSKVSTVYSDKIFISYRSHLLDRSMFSHGTSWSKQFFRSIKFPKPGTPASQRRWQGNTTFEQELKSTKWQNQDQKIYIKIIIPYLAKSILIFTILRGLNLLLSKNKLRFVIMFMTSFLVDVKKDFYGRYYKFWKQTHFTQERRIVRNSTINRTAIDPAHFGINIQLWALFL